jgi:hypothetical protein
LIALVAVAAFALAVDAEPDVRVYLVDAPAAPGIYRIEPTKAVSDVWAISRLNAAAVFDADGKRVACDKLLRSSPLLATPAHHAVKGHWLVRSKLAAPTTVDGFAYDRVWTFEPPALGETEKNVYLDIEWRTSVDSATSGDLQIIPDHPRQDGSGPLRRMSLRDIASRTGQNESRLYIDGLVLTGELRFRNAPADIEIDHVVFDTATTRPWARATIDEPGWILFKGNGKTPYRLQIAREGESCGGIGITWLDDVAAAPEWPPAATLGSEIPHVARLGDPNQLLGRRLADAAQRGWIRWSILVGILFVLACALAIATDKHQRGDV